MESLLPWDLDKDFNLILSDLANYVEYSDFSTSPKTDETFYRSSDNFIALQPQENCWIKNSTDEKEDLKIFNWMKGVPSSKKRRQVYSRWQTFELEKEYCYNKYLNRKHRREIAQQICLSDRQVKIWFQNRRMKEKRNKLKRLKI